MIKLILKYKKPILIILAGVLLIVLSGFVARNYHNKALNSLSKRITHQNDSIILLSQKRYDSVVKIANTAIEGADLMRKDNDMLRTSNNNLYYELKNERKRIRTTDTSFSNNSQRISDGNDKYHARDNDLR